MPENKKCILVIDDEDDVCQIIREKFEPLGFKVLIAYEGVEGLRKTQEGKPDCVLLDIRIPKVEDGLTYLRKLRAFDHNDVREQTRMRKTPVVVLTGAGISTKALFEPEGISGFIEKPFNVTNLQTKIQQILKT